MADERSHDDKVKHYLAMQELERRRRLAPLLFWRPHPRQKEAIDACKHRRIVIACGGNRWGKSTLNAAEAVATAYGYRPWEVPDLELTSDGDYPPREDVDPAHWILNAEEIPLSWPPRILIMTGLSMQRGIGTVMWPKIQSFLPRAVLTHPSLLSRKGPYGVPVEVVLPNGAVWTFGSKEQAPMMLEGAEFDRLLADEPMPRTHWTPIWRGLIDRFGTALFGMTPIGPDAPFVYEAFVASERKDVAVIRGSIHDNPTLSKEAVREFLNSGEFTEEELAARESGAWMFLTHRAFPTYDPHYHVVAPFHIPEGWVKGMVIDPAHRRPWAIVWMAFGPGGEHVVYREWPTEEHHKMRSSRLTAPEYASIIRNAEGGERIDFRILDPRFGKAQHRVKGEVHTSIQEDLARVGLYFDCRIPGTEREETGIERIRELLRHDRNAPLSPLNCPKLQVFSTCVNSKLALEQSNFAPPSARDPDVLPEKLLELFKDFRDCIRYLALYPRPPAGGPRGRGYIDPRDLEEINNL